MRLRIREASVSAEPINDRAYATGERVWSPSFRAASDEQWKNRLARGTAAQADVREPMGKDWEPVSCLLKKLRSASPAMEALANPFASELCLSYGIST